MASIAVTAVIHPSRLLRLVLYAYALCAVLAALWLAWNPSGMFAHHLSLSLLSLLAGAVALRAHQSRAKAHQIDISGLGQIRLTVQQSVGGEAHHAQRLLPASTLWPHLMLLLLRGEGGGRTALLVLPDSTAPAAFRALSVACRAVARRTGPPQK